MNKNIEKIDGYLKGVALPEHVSEQLHHERRLLRHGVRDLLRHRLAAEAFGDLVDVLTLGDLAVARKIVRLPDGLIAGGRQDAALGLVSRVGEIRAIDHVAQVLEGAATHDRHVRVLAPGQLLQRLAGPGELLEVYLAVVGLLGPWGLDMDVLEERRIDVRLL